MLRVVHANQAEGLLAALLEAMPPLDPFAPATIVSGSHLISRWLTREIAFARGIASGLDILTFDRFVERTWARDAAGRTAQLEPLDRRQLAAALASVLADGAVVRGHAPVAAYLAAAPDAGDRAGPRRVQLANHLANLWWSYALSRPDWMPALAVGRAPAELEGDPTAVWQAALVGTALARLPRERRYAPTPMLPWARRRAGIGTPRLATPVAVFGMSFLARAQLEALTDLAQTTDVTIYLLDPCRELWDDVVGRRRAGAEPTAQAIDDPLPLILWGRPVRDTLAALVERTGGDLEPRFVELDGPTARERLLADVMTRTGAARDPGSPSPPIATEAGVVVHACPNPRREIEIVADAVRRHLDADPTLRAHEIAVWIAGDVERYLAQTPSAFEAVGVPCHLIDAPVDDRGRIGEAVLALLELPTSTMARRDLLRVMTHPAVIARFPHADPADWVRWTERLGIAHGADSRAHDGTYLEEHKGQFHWDQGVRRLALGAFMVGERAERGPVRIGDLEVSPEEVRPELQASAATYALLVRSLCADAAWLAGREATLREWSELFVGLVDAYLAHVAASGGGSTSRAGDSGPIDATRDVERARAMLAGLAHLDLDGRPLGFREAREHAIQVLGSARSNRGEPLASGVMVAPLQAMRGIPARVVFVIGLDEGAFPAGEQPSPLDLRREQRIGDVSPRDRDRAAFLEVLLGVRATLHLSYVAVEAKSGQPLSPSSVVLELADALAPYLGAASSRAALALLTVDHPLHRFSRAAAAAPNDVLPAIARERWAATVRDAARAHLRAADHVVPDEDGMQALLDYQDGLRAELGLVAAPATIANQARTRPLSISNLRGFLEYPIQAWAQAVLGLDELPDDAAVEASDEPFQLGRAQRAVMLREVFAAQLRDPGASVELRYDTAVKDLALRGQFPVGVFAEAARVLDLRILDAWRTRLGPIAVGGATRIGFGRASSPGAELRPALELELPAAGNRCIRIVGQTELLLRSGGSHTSIITMIRSLKKKSHYHLRGAFDHVMLAAAGLALEGHVHQLIDLEGNDVVIRHAPWTQADARAFLTSLAVDLLEQAHGYLLPFDNLVRALGGGRAASARSHGGDKTAGLGFGPIVRRDGLGPPDDAVAIAHRRLAPLVSRMLGGEHGFEIGSRGARA